MPQFEDWLSQADQHRQKTGRPLVGLCFAQSLDGCLAARPGQPTQLSGPQSSHLTHQLRAAHDAILVGVGTLVADDPQLTVRLASGRLASGRLASGQNPQPVILDSRLRTPLQAKLVKRTGQPVWIATTPSADPARKAALEGAGARLLVLPADEQGRVSLAALLEKLAEEGVSSLMVEGGAQVITGFLTQGLADWMAITIAPVLLGGLPALGPGLPGLTRLKEVHTEQLGEDMMIFGRLR
jgi:3,4-dihydroxy 2-butanone 4-phosphate synthase/GTP cyclohydrolase II